MNKKIILLIPLVFLASACNRQPMATIGGHRLNIEIAATAAEQEQGLSGRDFLGTNDAMYFEFSQLGKPAFWMKGMKFPLDFIWVKDGKVMGITANAAPEPGIQDQDLHIYTPSELINGSLEVNAGWVKENGIKAGDTVELTK